VVNIRNMMFGRPINCRYCPHGYYALQHVVNYAQQKGNWTLIDIQAEQANKEPMYQAIDEHDPFSLYHFGHGNDCVVTGDMEQAIFTCSECSKLSGRIVYLLSCLTANGLGPAIIQNGGRAYAGFNISWTWMSLSGTQGDPYDDLVARGFFEGANELWLSLLDHNTFGEACQQSRDKYTEWIDYWYQTGGPYAASCMRWLLHNRDGLVELGDLEVRLTPCDTIATKQECETIGCYWYNNSCHGELPVDIADTKHIYITTTTTHALPLRLTHPPEVYEHFNYEISYEVTNTGGDGTLFGRIRDTDTDEILPNTNWENTIRHNQTIYISHIIYDMTKDMHLQLEVGHL